MNSANKPYPLKVRRVYCAQKSIQWQNNEVMIKKERVLTGYQFLILCEMNKQNRHPEFFAQNPKLETGPEGQKLKVLSSRYRKWRTQPVYGVASTSQFLFLLCGDAYKSLICVLQTTNLASQENTWWNVFNNFLWPVSWALCLNVLMDHPLHISTSIALSGCHGND